jgi:hypothetical protein
MALPNLDYDLGDVVTFYPAHDRDRRFRPMATGRVVAYAERPTVVLENPFTGQRSSVVADLPHELIGRGRDNLTREQVDAALDQAVRACRALVKIIEDESRVEVVMHLDTDQDVDDVRATLAR